MGLPDRRRARGSPGTRSVSDGEDDGGRDGRAAGRAGAWTRSSACPATASTESSRRCASTRTRSGSSRCRHEEGAAFAACGYAKFTGRLGVCIATSGPGRHPSPERPLRRQAGRRPGAGHHRADLPRPDRHALPAGDRHPAAVRGRRRLQPADHGAGARARAGRRRLPRGAVGPRASRTSTCRNDIQEQSTSDEDLADERSRGTRPWPGRPPIVVPQARVAQGAPRRCSTRGKKIVILAGQGALGAGDELERVADVAGGADHQAAAGQGGRARRLAVHHRRHRPAGHPALREGDGGVRQPADRRHELPLHEVVLPSPARPGPSRSTSTRPRIGLRYPVEVGLVGDAKATLQALLPLLQRQAGPLVPGEGPGAA